MRNRLLSSNGRPGEALRSCQDAGAGGAGIADVWDSAKDPAIGVSSRPFSYWEWGFTAMAVNRAVSSHPLPRCVTPKPVTPMDKAAGSRDIGVTA